MLAPVLLSLDAFPAYLDLSTTPEDMLPWLAQWLGIALDPSQELQHVQRGLLRSAGELHATRGTQRGIELAVEAALGVPVEVTETGGAAWSETPGRRAARRAAAGRGGDRPPRPGPGGRPGTGRGGGRLGDARPRAAPDPDQLSRCGVRAGSTMTPATGAEQQRAGSPLGLTGVGSPILRLQSAAGNRAVAGYLQRLTEPSARASLQRDELSEFDEAGMPLQSAPPSPAAFSDTVNVSVTEVPIDVRNNAFDLVNALMARFGGDGGRTSVTSPAFTPDVDASGKITGARLIWNVQVLVPGRPGRPERRPSPSRRPRRS